MNPAVIQDISTARPAQGLHSRIILMALASVFVFTAVTRLVDLAADPPWWMQGAFISDEGWWADAARGKVLFGNYFSDDFGTAYLITPGYTWILEAVYHRLGVGTPQTRLPEAIASLLTIALVAGMLWRSAGRLEALIAALMLALSPFYWSYGRIGLQEMMQAFFATAAFAFWFLSRRARWAAVAAGGVIGLAIIIKPNSINLGLFPLVLATAAGWAVEAAGLEPSARTRLHQRWWRCIGLGLLGSGVVLGVFFLFHALPNWPAFKALALAESGAPEARFVQHIKFLGMFLISMENREGVNMPIVWNPAHWSPALIAAFWFLLLDIMLRLRAGLGHLLRSLGVLEAMTLAWALGILIDIGTAFYQPDRRYVLVFPPLAIVSALMLGRTLRAAVTFTRRGLPSRSGFILSFFIWFVLTLPLLVLLKPPLTAWIMKLFAGVKIGRDPGLDYSAAGTLFMMGWLPALAAAAWWRPVWAESAAVALLRRPVILLLPACLLAVEAGVVGLEMVRRQDTMTRRQAELSRVIQPGETVLGHVATTLLMPLPVRTVRRVSRFEYTPPPNPDVWERLRPRYILEMTWRNYEPMPPLYADLITREHYRSLRKIEVGPRHNGEPRYIFELFER